MSINITLPQAPTDGNTLIAIVGLTDSAGLAEVSSISQVGATWQRAVQGDSGEERVEIWFAYDVLSASVSITINTVADENETAVVSEYFGLSSKLGTPLDRTALNSGTSDKPDTGTTDTTTNPDELLVGGFAIRSGEALSNPTGGFSIQAQQASGSGSTHVNTAFLDQVVTASGPAGTSGDTTSVNDFGGAVATFFGSLQGAVSVSPTIVPSDGGHELVLLGIFNPDKLYDVYIGPNGDLDDPVAYWPGTSIGKVQPVSPTEMRVYTPDLPPGVLVSVVTVRTDDPTLSSVLLDVIQVIDADYKSLVFQMRKLFPPNYRVGNRDLASLPRVSEPEQQFLYTEDFTQVVWDKNGISAVGGEADARGGTNGVLLQEDASTGEHNLIQTLSVTADETYTMSAYLKEGTRRWAALEIERSSNGDTIAQAFFDLQEGETGTVRGGIAEIQDVGSGWYRCALTWKQPLTEAMACIFAIAEADDDLLFTGLSADSIRMSFPTFDTWSVPRIYRRTEAEPLP